MLQLCNQSTETISKKMREVLAIYYNRSTNLEKRLAKASVSAPVLVHPVRRCLVSLSFPLLVVPIWIVHHVH